MGRYRPPATPKSPYITRHGYETLQAELNTLWKRRHHVTEALSAAAAEGDRSENAEYIYRKKELREIDRRIRYLQKRLPELAVVDRVPENKEQIFFGAWVMLEDQDGQEHHYRIVGPDEFDMQEEFISMDSPMARALLKRHLDDSVTVKTPNGEFVYAIIEVRYN